jgi:hypothetical protein
MGTIYRKYCETCDADSGQKVTFEGFAGAVISNGNAGGEIIDDGYLALLKPTGELVALPHPVEDSALREQGETWSGATWSGRILHVTNLICPECGTMNTTASLSANSYGCVCGLVLAAGMAAVCKWWFKLSGPLEMLMIWSALFLPNLLISFYLRTRFQENARPFLFERCKCGSKKAVSVKQARKKVFPCTRCKNKSVRIAIAGRS